MAKEKTCSVCGGSLCTLCSVAAVIIGVLFLLQDLAIWNFWNISWYTAAFLIAGLAGVLGMFNCNCK